ncbi:MAG: type II toxin-antitoxin system Phd/YefM family antitoxin [Hormoscilla sp. GM7CHS1pb]|nr:type II toxin-antitoxin system Phd/YefM family antitoxin [Hormoscilla sp. GM7CHS1pb]
MISLHPEFLSKNGKKEFAVLPYEEFVRIEELLADIEYLRDLREAKQSEAQLPTVTLEEVKRRLGRS